MNIRYPIYEGVYRILTQEPVEERRGSPPDTNGYEEVSP